MDYAMKKGVSLSTLRRHIKANKVQYRVENGRYLLLDEEAHVGGGPSGAVSAAPGGDLSSKLNKLERDLAKAQEEIAELKMLVALYEEKMAPSRLDS